MFHREPDASKAAFVAAVERFRTQADPPLIDIQMLTPHMERLGAREIPRREFLALLRKPARKPET
jgi:leucyl/phenylalanyl-tRNA--protein transferase